MCSLLGHVIGLIIAVHICFADALETIQDKIDKFEDVGASEEEADFLQDFFDEPALGALLEVILMINDGCQR